MEVIKWLPLACAALLWGCAPRPDSAGDPVGDMLAVMEGTYATEPNAAPDAELPDLLDRRVRVVAPAFGAHVVYWQLNSGPDREVYRQRLLSFAAEGDRIVQTTWSFVAPEKFVDAFDSPGLFADLSDADVEPTLPEGCDQVWQKTADGWYGSVNPDTCRVWSERRQQWRRIGAEAMVLQDAYLQAERGFDDDGKQLFGTRPGDMYRLTRTAANR
jgi:hypothetical protein